MARPTKYTDDLGDELIKWMSDGYSLTAAAGKIGVCRQTVYAWAEEKAEFSNALNQARAASAAWWEDLARHNAVTGEGNATLTVFGLKNRVADEWRDRRENDHTSSDGTMSPQRIVIEPASSGDSDDQAPS